MAWVRGDMNIYTNSKFNKDHYIDIIKKFYIQDLKLNIYINYNVNHIIY